MHHSNEKLRLVHFELAELVEDLVLFKIVELELVRLVYIGTRLVVEF